MLGQLRDRIQNAQHDLSASIRDKLIISSSAKAEVRHRLGIAPVPVNPNVQLDVNLQAGADLISYYQCRWQELHSAGLENGALARKISGDINQANSHVAALRSTSTKLLNELTTLPALEQSLAAIEAEMSKSLGLFAALEDAITELSQEVAGREYEERKGESEAKINDMISRRTDDLRMLESQYVAREEARLREKAEREAQQLRDRQAVFQQAFEEELKLYKEKGRLERSVSQKDETAEPPEEVDQKLANISLEIDADEVDALESFLKD